MQGDSENLSGKRVLHGSSADPSPAAKIPKKGGKAQLIDVEADGTEISRRDKGPGRAPSGYAKRADGNWYKTALEDGSASKNTDAGTELAAGGSGKDAANQAAIGAVEALESEVVKDGMEVDGGAVSAEERGSPPRAAFRFGDEETALGRSRPGSRAWGEGETAAASVEQHSLRGNLLPRSEAQWDPAPTEWVVFSDLHVSRATLPTCLEILDRVHEEAVRRGAGVIFLGDFWHEKGVLRIEPLNAILQAFSQWTVPLVALPGNHDQATLDGELHALVPLALVLPSAYIISQPTVLLNALWIPFRRDPEEVKQAMAGMVTEEVGAVFCHVDVLGADMGGGYLAERGLAVGDFPAHLPVFTGHYHKSHNVASPASHHRAYPVRYVGSQYQTSMREAEERKVMLVLRAPSQMALRSGVEEDSGLQATEEAATEEKATESRETQARVWSVQEEMPVEFGVRHFRAQSLEELQKKKAEWALRKGDRVQVCVADAKAARGALRALEKELAVRLEVREEAAGHRMARVPAADTLDAMALLRMFFEENGSGIDARVKKEAEKLLTEVQEEFPAEEQAAREVVLERVEVTGFGSFGFDRRVSYPLAQRGVVLVVGKNEDEDSSDSNGSGKTTLCMAALWAMTGSADVRADGKRLGRRDVVHSTAVEGQEDLERSTSDDAEDDGAESAQGKRRRRPTTTVSLFGTVNGTPFEVRRRTNSGRLDGALAFFYNGEDLTRSTMKDTQAEIQRILPVQVLSDAVFHGQHLVTGLLEKTDKDFKVALDNLIPTEVWSRALDKARERKKDARGRQDELAGRIKEKESEEEPIAEQLQKAREEMQRWEREHSAEVEQLQRELEVVEAKIREEGMVLEQCRLERKAAVEALGVRQGELERVVEEMQVARKMADGARLRAESVLRERRDRKTRAEGAEAVVRARVAEMGRAAGRLAAAQERRGELERIEREWRERQRAGAAQALGESSKAMVKVEAAREDLQNLLEAQEEELEALIAARNASEEELEDASRRAGAALERVEVARERAEQYKTLKHDPACPLCLQPIKEGDHAGHLQDMEAEVEKERGEQAAAEAERQRARAERDAKAAAVEYVRERGAQEAAAQRKVLQEREEEWRMARSRVVALDGETQSPQHVALGAAREEEARGGAEMAQLRRDVERALGSVVEDEQGEQAAAMQGGEGGEGEGGGRVWEAATVLERVEQRVRAAEEKVQEAERERDAAVERAEQEEEKWDARLASLREATAEARRGAAEADARVEAAGRREAERGQLAERLERERKRENPLAVEQKRLEAAAAAARERLGQLEKERDAAEGDGRVWGKLEELFGKRGLQNFVYEVAVLDLQRRAAGYLELLSDDCLRLELSLGEQVVDRTLLVRSAAGGYSRRSLQQLSGGQWRRLSLALSLAFSQASLERTHTTCNLIVLDEVMQHLDSEGCARVARLLGSLVDGDKASFQTALVILQTAVGEELGDSFDEVDVVVKKGDSSFVRSAAGKIY